MVRVGLSRSHPGPVQAQSRQGPPCYLVQAALQYSYSYEYEYEIGVLPFVPYV